MRKLKRPLLLFGFMLATVSAPGQPNTVYVWRNFVGQPGGQGSADGTGSAARFNNPQGVAVDGAGNVFVADCDNNTIRKVTSTGVVTTLAGSAGARGTNDGTGSTALFSEPSSMAVDRNGNLFVADYRSHTIRKITSNGVVTTLAGGPGVSGTNEGTGGAARFHYPVGVAVDTNGTVYVADMFNHTIRKVTNDGVVTTFAGSAGVSGTNDGPGSVALFKQPCGVAVDGAGNVYVADTYNYTIRKITNDRVVTTLAGSAGQSYDTDGTGSTARFNVPWDVAVDSAGNLLVADWGSHTIRMVTSGGVVTTLAGKAGQAGSVDGTGSAARFYNPMGVAVDREGNVYVADTQNHSARKVTSAGVVTTLAGAAGNRGKADGTGSAARFYQPLGVAVDTNGTVYAADTQNHTIRKATSSGVVTTLAGNPLVTGTNDGTRGVARFTYPRGLTTDSEGNVYVADYGNHTIRKVTSSGVVTTLAGHGGAIGTNDDTGDAARFYNPTGVAVDSGGNVYVADGNNHTVRKITSSRVVTTLAGSAGQSGTNDGTGSAALFRQPGGIAVDSAGNVYVADSGNHTIRIVTSAGVVTTLAGSAGVSGSADGTGSAARFYNPSGLAMDSAGYLYVADYTNQMIRRVTSAGVVTTVGGAAGVGGGVEGIGSLAQFSGPWGIAVDSTGRLYVADSYNNRISKGIPLPAMTIAQSGTSVTLSWLSLFTGFALEQNGDACNASGWSSCGYSIADDGTNKSITVPSPTGNLFFRLVGY